jgi:hypothetical protein
MRTLMAAMVLAASICSACSAEDLPKPPPPVKEHDWLKQLTGEWTMNGEMSMGPGKTLKSTGRDSVKMLGGYWVVSDLTQKWDGQPMSSRMTIGYDPKKSKYVGTFISDSDATLWTYIGDVDPAGKVLTLEAEGPDMSQPGKLAKNRDIMSLQDADHRTLTSEMQAPDGKWFTFGTVKYKRIGAARKPSPKRSRR